MGILRASSRNTATAVCFTILYASALTSAAGCATDASTDPLGDEIEDGSGGKADGTSLPVNIPASHDACSSADTPGSWEVLDAPLAARQRAQIWARDVFPTLPGYVYYYKPKLEKVISMTDSSQMILQLTDVKPPGFFVGQGNYEITRSWVVFVDGTSYRHIESRFAFPVGSSYMLADPKTPGGSGNYDTRYILVDEDGDILATNRWMEVNVTRVADDAVVIHANATLSLSYPMMYVARPEGVYLLHDSHYLVQVAPVCTGYEGAWAKP